MFKINPDLRQKIKEILHVTPQADEEMLIEKLSSNSTLRIKKEVIAKGVREYMKTVAKPAKPLLAVGLDD